MAYPSVKEILNNEQLPFYEATKEDRLIIQKCSDCNQHQFYPRVLCTNCYSDNVEWVDASGNGKVYSFTIVTRTQDPLMKDKLPYVVALIDLEEGVRLMSHVVDVPPEDVHVGMDVSVIFRESVDEYKLPQFVPWGN